MKIPAKAGLLVRFAAGGSAGLLFAVGIFALLLQMIDVPVTNTRAATVTWPAVKAPTILDERVICKCAAPWKPSRVHIDFPLLHELLSPLTALVATTTFSVEIVDVPVPIDFRLIE